MNTNSFLKDAIAFELLGEVKTSSLIDIITIDSSTLSDDGGIGVFFDISGV